MFGVVFCECFTLSHPAPNLYVVFLLLFSFVFADLYVVVVAVPGLPPGRGCGRGCGRGRGRSCWPTFIQLLTQIPPPCLIGCPGMLVLS